MKNTTIIFSLFVLIVIACTKTNNNYQKDTLNIKSIDNNVNSKSTITIAYQGLTLSEAYLEFLNDNPTIGKHLSKKLSPDDNIYTSTIDDENVEILYHPILDEDGLFIKLSYPNSITTVNFEYRDDGIHVQMIRSL